MKRLIPTLILVIICIGAFWYASSKDFFKEKTEPAASLVKVNKDEVASYSVKTADSEVEIQRKDGSWTMSKPSPLPLSEFAVSGWVESFNNVSKDKTVEANPSDLAQFGLDKPAKQFTVTMNDGTSHTLSVGSPVAIQGLSYAMVSGSPEVFTVSDMAVQPLARAPLDFMEKSPVKLDYEQLRELSVEWKGQKWTLAKVDVDKKSYDAEWKLGDQTLKGTDASTYLDKVQSMSTAKLARPAAEIKMDAPELRIETKSADASGNQSATAYIGKVEQEQVWVTQEGGQWAYSLPVTTVQELADKMKQPPPDPAAAQPQGGTAPPAPAQP
ncbi:DUF4340 domain-containing protein [Paenibacillus xerothermodurans]|uniref:DUF4340 domain-containing protein n=1 Tax=Paenibacillus xerothermodurans TaxID=1977292 RepID=A0A2W1NJL6_PAEXE|nr:DUF4340 domain-containing protein [Paenibacillus xerothermodurans]PZE19243.1 DUF4340 domain-containing protein [Paenibacillus xerothermodurans]